MPIIYIETIQNIYQYFGTIEHTNKNTHKKQKKQKQMKTTTNKQICLLFFAEPDEVNNVTVSNITKSSVQVTWDIPSLNPGPVNYTAVAEDNVLGNSLLNKMCSEQGEELLP